jgi:hypothetical protein
MNESLWVPTVLAVILGAFLLPVVICLYRLENWITTWPRPAWERAERRDGFEVQLAAFLERERRQGYQPPWSALRLFGRMLSRAPWDFSDAARALDCRVAAATSKNPQLSFRLAVAGMTLGLGLMAMGGLLTLGPLALRIPALPPGSQAMTGLLCAMYVYGFGLAARGLITLHRLAYSRWLE